jgi:transposase-like protein
MTIQGDEGRATCPTCKEPNVLPMSDVDKKWHYRCPRCLWSFTRKSPTKEDH